MTISAASDEVCAIKSLNNILIWFPISKPSSIHYSPTPLGLFGRNNVTRKLQERNSHLGDYEGNYTVRVTCLERGAATSGQGWLGCLRRRDTTTGKMEVKGFTLKLSPTGYLTRPADINSPFSSQDFPLPVQRFHHPVHKLPPSYFYPHPTIPNSMTNRRV